jgi:hypothetical protein
VADALSTKGVGIATRVRFWKKEAAGIAEADVIVAETRIPSSELPEMSDARLSEGWRSISTVFRPPFGRIVSYSSKKIGSLTGMALILR